jgi:F0F1-type ATP synthase membrane subunit c/vacuolar-type H+-ATPase subunit K
MSGIIAVYALVIAVLIAGDMGPPPSQHYSLFTGFMHLASGLSVGGAGLAAGYAIGIVGDQGVRSYMQQSRVFVGMVLILIFGEVLGLYGLIVGLILNSKSWNRTKKEIGRRCGNKEESASSVISLVRKTVVAAYKEHVQIKSRRH